MPRDLQALGSRAPLSTASSISFIAYCGFRLFLSSEPTKAKLIHSLSNGNSSYTTDELNALRSDISEYNDAVNRKKTEITELTEKLEGRKADLVLKKNELEQIISETKQDEEKLKSVTLF